MRKKRFLSLALAVVMLCGLSAFVPTVSAASGTASVVNLKVNFQVEPLCVDSSEAIRFSWNMESNVIGMGQSAYQIKMFEGNHTGGTPIWDSGKETSNISTGILYEGPALSKETRYTWTVDVTATDEVVYSARSFFETECGFDGVSWIIPTSETVNSALLRTERTLSGDSSDVAYARLYITALGALTPYINGEEVMFTHNGQKIDDIFSPGWTDFRYYTNYFAYDVTDYLTSKTFALGVMLGKGFYGGRINGDVTMVIPGVISVDKQTGPIIGNPNIRELAMIAKLVVTYENGRQDVFDTSGSAGWTSSARTPVTANDFYQGEDYDANIAKEISGWNDVGFDDSTWDSVKTDDSYVGALHPSSKAVARIATEYTRTPIAAYTYNTTADFVATPEDLGHVTRHNVNIKDPIALTAGDTLIVDLGQNIAGVAEISVNGTQGTVVTMRHAEMLNDGKKDPALGSSYGGDGPKDTLYLRAIGNIAIDHYTLSDEGLQTYHPLYTYHGFRYLEITANDDITVHGVKGLVFTAVGEQLGMIQTSDSNVNQLFNNVLWGQKGNNISVPTDNTQRSERHGWTGDAQVYAQTGVYNYDVLSFMENYTELLNAHAKDNDDNYGSIVPMVGNVSGILMAAGWSDAGITIPYILYKQTGDTALIDKYYDQMSAYMDALKNGDLGNNYNQTFYGDWLGFNPASTASLCRIYHIYDAQLMAEMADVLGRTAEKAKYEQLFADLKEAFIDHYVDADGNLLCRTADGVDLSYHNYQIVDNAQTALAWALKLGLYNTEAQRDAMVRNLVRSIRNENQEFRPYAENTLAVGFLGVNVLLPALSVSGVNDTAYDLFLQDGMPSWLYAVKAGATTVWERWDSYSTEIGFGTSSMNSFNHYAYGSVVEWMYEYMAGIKAAAPGFKEITLQPAVDASNRITWVNGAYKSLYGTIISNWTATGGKLSTYSCTVPANTTATLYLPVDEAAMDDFYQIPGVTYLGMEEHNGLDCAKLSLLSGSFDFEVTTNGLVALHTIGINAILASVRSDGAAVAVNSPAAYTVSLNNAKGAGIVTLSFTADSRYLDLTDATALSGFTILGPLAWEYMAGGVWKGTVKLFYPGFVKTDAPLDILKISGTARDVLGNTTVTLTGISVTGDVNGSSSTMPSAIKAANAATSIVPKAPVYSKHDLNKDGKINEQDLAIVVYYYLANDLEPDWAVVKFDVASAKDCDVAVNGIVDLADMIEIIANYRDSYNLYP